MSIDIVDIVSEYSDLVDKGNDRYACLCPFHEEVTPSFVVNKNKQSFFCFGCETGGNVDTFLIKMLQKISTTLYRNSLDSVETPKGYGGRESWINKSMKS